MSVDVIDQLVGQPLAIRKRRPITIEQSQKSYDALFHGKSRASFTQAERFAIAVFVAHLHQHKQAIEFYESQLQAAEPQLLDSIRTIAIEAKSSGPFGQYPAGPLTREDLNGKIWQSSNEEDDKLTKKLTSALNHTHLLVFHPRDSKKKDIDALTANGWQENDIVTLSQLVSFLSFQIKLAIGLQVLSQIA